MNYFETAKADCQKKYGILASILPELIAVRFGLKKALTLKLSAKIFQIKHQNALKKILSASNLYVEYYPSIMEGNSFINMLISNQKLSVINDNEKDNADNRFSYPSCCIDAFLKKDGAFYFENRNRDLSVGEKMDDFDFRMNPFLIASPFHLYSHLPCSLRCSKTLDYAKKLLDIIKCKNKQLYYDIIHFNRAPVLYIDICGTGILFKGIAKKQKIIYKSFYYDFFPQKNVIERSNNNIPSDRILYHKLIKELAKGDQIDICDSGLMIRKGTELVAKVDRPNHLHWRILYFK